METCLYSTGGSGKTPPEDPGEPVACAVAPPAGRLAANILATITLFGGTYSGTYSGAWELAAPTDPPPESTALGPLWIASTDTAGVTELLDRRVFAADIIVIPLRGPLPVAPDPIAEAVVVHDGLILEDVLYRLSDSGGGSAGQIQLDLLLDGATLYLSFSQDDHRPAWPFDTAALSVQGRIHELTELRPGQLLQLVSIQHPTGGTPAWAEAYLLCRRP